jgi:DNA-binding transcriptional LysR family regulator
VLPLVLCELGSAEANKRLVEAGLGFGILPEMAVADTLSRGGLVACSLTPRLSRKLALALRRDKRMDKGLREVVSALGAIDPPKGWRECLLEPTAAACPHA